MAEAHFNVNCHRAGEESGGKTTRDAGDAREEEEGGRRTGKAGRRVPTYTWFLSVAEVVKEKLRPSNLTSLGEAVRVVLAQPKDTPGRQERVKDLRAQLRTRSKSSNDISILQLCLDLDLEAFSMFSPDNPGRTAQLHDLLQSISRLAAHTHQELPALGVSVDLCRTLYADPANATVKSAVRDTLADVIFAREQLAATASFDEVISLRRETLASIPRTDPARAEACVKLAHPLVLLPMITLPTFGAHYLHMIPLPGFVLGLVNFGVRQGQRAYAFLRGVDRRHVDNPPLWEATALLGHALRLHPPGHSERATTRAAVLNVCDGMTPEKLNGLHADDLEVLWCAALEVPEAPDPRRTKMLVFLGEHLWNWSVHDRGGPWFDDAISIWRLILRAGPSERELALDRLSDLLFYSQVLRPKSEYGKPAFTNALDEVIKLKQELLRLLPPSERETRARHKASLAQALLLRGSNLADMEQALALMREARPHLQDYSYSVWYQTSRALVMVLQTKYEHTRDAKMLIEARTVESEMSTFGRVAHGARAASNWMRGLFRSRTEDR
jgi:hypothetical protein